MQLAVAMVAAIAEFMTVPLIADYLKFLTHTGRLRQDDVLIQEPNTLSVR
jgi:hypothetical protein